MRQVTKSKLKKWSIGAGCTLSLALIFNQVQSGEAFAVAKRDAGAAGKAGAADQQAIASQDRVMNEFEGFKQDQRQRQLEQGGEADGGTLGHASGNRGRTNRGFSAGSGDLGSSSPPSVSEPAAPQSKPKARSSHS